MPDTNINEILAQQQAIEARLLELKQTAWNGGDDLDKTSVGTAIVPSIYAYVKNEQEGVQTVSTPIILNINGNQYIINSQDNSDDNIEEDNKTYNFDLTVPGWFIENPNKAEHFVQDTITDADFSEIPGVDEETPAVVVEEETTDENIPAAINTEDIETYHIDQLKQEKAELNQNYVELEAQRWIAFVKNLIAYINDFEPIIVKTVHDGEYQIDANTDFGLIAILNEDGTPTLDENNTPTYEATSVSTIFITTETVTAPVEDNSAEDRDELAPPTEPEEGEEDTDNVSDDTEI